MDIQQLVVSHVSALSKLRPEEIRLDHTLLGDVKMDGDDFSYLFVPGLEKSLGMKLPQSDWAGVRTVGDVIQMVRRKTEKPG
jgi:acyl carrier protein